MREGLGVRCFDSDSLRLDVDTSKANMDPLPVTCSHRSGMIANTSIPDRLTSDAGVDYLMAQGEFRSSVEQGCSICVALYGMAVRCNISSGMAPFRIVEIPEANLADKRETLVLNAQIAISESHESPSVHIAARTAENRYHFNVEFEVYAIAGN